MTTARRLTLQGGVFYEGTACRMSFAYAFRRYSSRATSQGPHAVDSEPLAVLTLTIASERGRMVGKRLSDDLGVGCDLGQLDVRAGKDVEDLPRHLEAGDVAARRQVICPVMRRCRSAAPNRRAEVQIVRRRAELVGDDEDLLRPLAHLLDDQGDELLLALTASDHPPRAHDEVLPENGLGHDFPGPLRASVDVDRVRHVVSRRTARPSCRRTPRRC